MKRLGKNYLIIGSILLFLFVVWTFLVMTVDGQAIGPNESYVGFATFNGWFHDLTGVHWLMYFITDWLGLVPIFVCMGFGLVGFKQLVERKSVFKVDYDIICLGMYYILVMVCYLGFEMFPINYRPILIAGRLEASYPSSTTLLVVSVMPTLIFQANRRLENSKINKVIYLLTILFMVCMVIGRLVSGVHWFTDIVGSILLSGGLFYWYKAIVLLCNTEK